jgi:hypothetical protein
MHEAMVKICDKLEVRVKVVENRFLVMLVLLAANLLGVIGSLIILLAK